PAIYSLSLHDALPISCGVHGGGADVAPDDPQLAEADEEEDRGQGTGGGVAMTVSIPELPLLTLSDDELALVQMLRADMMRDRWADRKSTRLNSSHVKI